MQYSQLIRIVIYSFVLLIVTLFEEPRISILLKLVFPEDFSRAFSYSIPFLVVCVSVISARPGNGIWKGAGAVSAFAFSAILILSYWNTILISVDESSQHRENRISELRTLISGKQKEFQKPAGVRNCYAPVQGTEGYDDLLAGYRSCVLTAKMESDRIEKQSSLLSAEISVLTADLDKLQRTGADWTKPITQAATGICLSIILSVTTSIFCLSLAKELNDLVFVSQLSEESRLAVYISEGYSVRQIAEILEISKSAADRKIREFRTIQEFRTVSVKNGIGNSRNSMNENHYAGNTYEKASVPSLGQQWDSAGTDWDTQGTEAGQAKKRPKNEDRGKDKNSSIFGSVFDSDFGWMAGSGRMA